MKKLVYIFYCLLLLISTYFDLFAQDKEKRKLSYSELFKEIKEAEKDPLFSLKGAEISLEFKGEDSVFTDIIKESIGGPGSITYPIVRNFDFNIPVYFYRCKFKLMPVFINCKFNYMEFVECTFDNVFGFDSCIFKNSLVIKNCTITNKFNITNSEIYYSEYGLSIEKSKINHLSLKNITIRIKPDDLKENNSSNPLIDIADSEIRNFWLQQIHLPDIEDETITDIKFSLTNVDNLGIKDAEFTRLNFDYLTVNKQILLDSIKIKDYISVESFDYPPENTNMSWKYFAGNKLCTYNYSTNKIFKASTPDELIYEADCNELISAYNKFYHMYKIRGDRQSANSCYVEMKDIENKAAELHL